MTQLQAAEASCDASNSRGWRCYTPVVLAGYDWWVHRISNRYFWRCPFSRLVEPYDRWGRARHLEIGVGTGLPLARSSALRAMQSVALLDANPSCLNATRRRLQRQTEVEIRTYVHDLAQPGLDPLGDEQFDSIGMTYLLHCLPDQTVKSQALALAARHLSPEGNLFGATLLGVPQCQTLMGRALESWYQRRGIFGNQLDDQEGIESMLHHAFGEVQVQVLGRALLFRTRRARG